MKMFAIPMGLPGMQQEAIEAPARPLPEAQIMEIDRRLELMKTVEVAVGDYVVEREGLGWLRDEMRQTMPMKILRMLDASDELDRAIMLDMTRRMLVDRADCLCVYLADDGSTMQFAPHCTAMLRKFEI